MNALEMKTLMTMPEHTLVPWGPNGQIITVGEAIQHLLRGEGMEISPGALPGATAQQPGQPAGPNIRISQAAVDSLSQAQYDELQQTGHLQGVTNSDNGRAIVHVSRGGTISVQRSFNPETGAVEEGRGLDMRFFHDPAAGS